VKWGSPNIGFSNGSVDIKMGMQNGLRISPKHPITILIQPLKRSRTLSKISGFNWKIPMPK
jgi:hypothetical protein